jgi:radical SAM-linked protein
VVQRIRVRYARRGRLRFSSHRDFARAFERALRRAEVPMAYSAGFSPHPKISYVGAAPTGVASEAEYLEIGLAERVDPDRLRATLDAALPAGLDVLECVPAGPGTLADRIDAGEWKIELPGAAPTAVSEALVAFLAADRVVVERRTKEGRRTLDARSAVVCGQVTAAFVPGLSEPCAILNVVVRQVSPTVRPDDVLAALRAVAGFEPPLAPRATRLAQGLLDDANRLADPLGPDRMLALPAREGEPGPAEQSPA